MNALLDIPLVDTENAVRPFQEKTELIELFYEAGKRRASPPEVLLGFLVPTLTAALGLAATGLQIERLDIEDRRTLEERNKLRIALGAQMLLVAAHLVVQGGFLAVRRGLTRSEQSGLIIDSIFGALILGANSIVSAFDDEASGAGIAAGILDPMPDLVSFLRLPYLVEMGGETQAIKIALDVLCGCAAGACTIADALDA